MRKFIRKLLARKLYRKLFGSKLYLIIRNTEGIWAEVVQGNDRAASLLYAARFDGFAHFIVDGKDYAIIGYPTDGFEDRFGLFALQPVASLTSSEIT